MECSIYTRVSCFPVAIRTFHPSTRELNTFKWIQMTYNFVILSNPTDMPTLKSKPHPELRNQCCLILVFSCFSPTQRQEYVTVLSLWGPHQDTETHPYTHTNSTEKVNRGPHYIRSTVILFPSWLWKGNRRHKEPSFLFLLNPPPTQPAIRHLPPSLSPFLPALLLISLFSMSQRRDLIPFYHCPYGSRASCCILSQLEQACLGSRPDI